jgi:hypothetical protein
MFQGLGLRSLGLGPRKRRGTGGSSPVTSTGGLVPPPITFNPGNPIPPQTPQVGVPFLQDISGHFQNGAPPIIYEIFSGGLPPGLALNPGNGHVTGTPTTPGNSGNVVFKATDGRGNSANSNGVGYNTTSVVVGTVGYHSLDRFNTSYAGACLKVRRSSDNTELDIGFVSNTLDRAALAAFVGAGNGFVSVWYDQIGTNNLAQATLASQPIIVDNGVVLDMLYFDGVDDQLLTPLPDAATTALSAVFRGHLRAISSTVHQVMFSWGQFYPLVTDIHPAIEDGYLFRTALTGGGGCEYQQSLTKAQSVNAVTLDATLATGIRGITTYANGVALASSLNVGPNAPNPLGASTFIVSGAPPNSGRMALHTLLKYVTLKSAADVVSLTAALAPTSSPSIDPYAANLWCCLHLWKKRAAYAGACIRVRRSSDNAEQDNGVASTGFVDKAALLAFVGAGNGFVVTWYDQSGSARNFTNATAASQPQVVAAGVFIGYVKLLGMPSGLRSIANSSGANSVFSAYVAGQLLGRGGQARLCTHNPADANNSVIVYWDTPDLSIRNVIVSAGSPRASSYVANRGAPNGGVMCLQMNRAGAAAATQVPGYQSGALMAQSSTTVAGALAGNFVAAPWDLGDLVGTTPTYDSYAVDGFALYEALHVAADVERVSRVMG